jgi:hypothetical protein
MTRLVTGLIAGATGTVQVKLTTATGRFSAKRLRWSLIRSIL